MIATILDYGAGNLHSLTNALTDDDIDVIVIAEPDYSHATDMLFLPVVGSF
jgi:imidazoleglycerol phosphate synthase glutamine amidotransferase subunit HisH